MTLTRRRRWAGGLLAASVAVAGCGGAGHKPFTTSRGLLARVQADLIARHAPGVNRAVIIAGGSIKGQTAHCTRRTPTAFVCQDTVFVEAGNGCRQTVVGTYRGTVNPESGAFGYRIHRVDPAIAPGCPKRSRQ